MGVSKEVPRVGRYSRPPPRKGAWRRFFLCTRVPFWKFFRDARLLIDLRFIFHSRSVVEGFFVT